MTRPLTWPRYARVPPFLPVPVTPRADGWTPDRQAQFIGYLAQTGSVAEAAQRVGMSRATAYRLRRREGAEGFAHAWDAVLAQRRGKAFPTRKVTPAELAGLAYHGPWHVLLRQGRFASACRKPSNSALLRLLRRFDGLASRGQFGDGR